MSAQNITSTHLMV